MKELTQLKKVYLDDPRDSHASLIAIHSMKLDVPIEELNIVLKRFESLLLTRISQMNALKILRLRTHAENNEDMLSNWLEIEKEWAQFLSSISNRLPELEELSTDVSHFTTPDIDFYIPLVRNLENLRIIRPNPKPKSAFSLDAFILVIKEREKLELPFQLIFKIDRNDMSAELLNFAETKKKYDPIVKIIIE